MFIIAMMGLWAKIMMLGCCSESIYFAMVVVIMIIRMNIITRVTNIIATEFIILVIRVIATS